MLSAASSWARGCSSCIYPALLSYAAATIKSTLHQSTAAPETSRFHAAWSSVGSGNGSGGRSISGSTGSSGSSSDDSGSSSSNSSSSDGNTVISDFGPYASLQPRRVVITGIGLVTPLGLGVTQVWQRLVAGETAVRQLQPEDLPEGHREALASLPSQVAALVPRAEVQQAVREMQEDPRRCSAFMQYALVAAAEALRDAGWSPCTVEQRQYTGVAVGNGMSSTAEVADAGQLLAAGKLRKLSAFFVPRILANMAAGAISIRWGLLGPNHCVSTACATGAHAIGDAYRMIQRGDANVMVAGASEACVDAIALAGFGRLRALSTSFGKTGSAGLGPVSASPNEHPSQPLSPKERAARASRPFDADRDGFVMGEGAGILVLEDLEHARARGAVGRAYAELRGYGMSGDGHHVTQPHPEAIGAMLCMQRALAGSGVTAQDVVYLNAHATSTPQGDEVEMHAIRKVFASADGGAPALAVSSTKGATGHLLGAAGAVEAAFTALAVKYASAPPTVNLDRPDPPGVLSGLIGTRAAPLPSRCGRIAAMCNSFGFGGTNACLLMTTPPRT